MEETLEDPRGRRSSSVGDVKFTESRIGCSIRAPSLDAIVIFSMMYVYFAKSLYNTFKLRH